jgi:hypothetical protein
VRRNARQILPLHVYDVVCFGAMAAVGAGVVLDMGFMQRSDMLGLGTFAGQQVLGSVLAGLAPGFAVLAANTVRKVAPLYFFIALAAGAAVFLGKAISLRLMLPSALT